MKIYFATWLDKGFGQILTKKKGRNRLISYYFLKAQKATPEQIREYITKGKLSGTK